MSKKKDLRKALEKFCEDEPEIASAGVVCFKNALASYAHGYPIALKTASAILKWTKIKDNKLLDKDESE